MHNFLKAIENFFGGAWHLLLQYLRIAIPDATAALLNDLLAIADPIVADLQNQGLSGEEKRKQAALLIQGKAVQAGWDVGVALIHAAIELAVLKQKALQPTGPVAPGGNMPGGESVTLEPVV